MSSQSYTLTAASPTLPSTGLGFAGRAVIVSNLTNQYVRIPDAAVGDIPPFVFGAVLSLPAGITQARATLVATVPTITGPPVPSAIATLIWTDEPLPASPGHLLQQSQFATDVALGTVVDPAGAGTSKTFSIPAGAQAIVVITDGSGPPQQINVTGHTTGGQYLFIATPLLVHVYTAPAWPGEDPQIDVFCQGRAGGPQIFYVGYSLAAKAIAVVAPKGEELAVSLNDVGGNPIALGQDASLPNGAQSIPVVPAATYVHAPWQAADQAFAVLSVLASGANSAALVTFTNKGYLFALSVTTDLTTAAGSVEVQNTAAGNALIAKGAVNAGGTGGPLINLNLSGASLDSAGGAIKGIRLANKGSAASDFYLTVSFTST